MNMAAMRTRFGFNPWVVAAILLLSVVLGVLNNLRVHEDQRAPWPDEDFADDAPGEDDDLLTDGELE